MSNEGRPTTQPSRRDAVWFLRWETIAIVIMLSTFSGVAFASRQFDAGLSVLETTRSTSFPRALLLNATRALLAFLSGFLVVPMIPILWMEGNAVGAQIDTLLESASGSAGVHPLGAMALITLRSLLIIASTSAGLFCCQRLWPGSHIASVQPLLGTITTWILAVTLLALAVRNDLPWQLIWIFLTLVVFRPLSIARNRSL